jgi:hypothetical protein
VPVVGGPTVPVVTVNEAEKPPLAFVGCRLVAPVASGGGPQETGVWFPSSDTVGCELSLLHSKMAPTELAA